LDREPAARGAARDALRANRAGDRLRSAPVAVRTHLLARAARRRDRTPRDRARHDLVAAPDGPSALVAADRADPLAVAGRNARHAADSLATPRGSTVYTRTTKRCSSSM